MWKLLHMSVSVGRGTEPDVELKQPLGGVAEVFRLSLSNAHGLSNDGALKSLENEAPSG
jgi:hypothetical protein